MGFFYAGRDPVLQNEDLSSKKDHVSCYLFCRDVSDRETGVSDGLLFRILWTESGKSA